MINLNAPVQRIDNAVKGLSGLAQHSLDVLGRLQTGSFWDQLRPASFLDVPFGVFEGESEFGRHYQVHEYPFRDTVWAEDLGRRAREFRVRGFLVGDDAIAQRDRLLAAVEAKADTQGAKLVHPTFGVRQVVLLEFQCTERAEQGRVFELEFTFVEQGRKQFPNSNAQTTAADAQDAASDVDKNAVLTFARKITKPLLDGAASVNGAVKQAKAWSDVATQVVRDATSLVNMVATLPGTFGRMVGVSARRGGTAMTVRDAAGQAAATRQAVAASITGLNSGSATISAADAQGFGTLSQGLAAAVQQAAGQPSDAVRSLVTLATFRPEIISDPSQIGRSAATVQRACGDLFRRAALAALVRVAVEFRLESSAVAVQLRDRILVVLDAELALAGDQGEDDVYASMRAMRAALVRDLNLRGAALPGLVAVRTAAPVPSLVLAQRLYRDAGRNDELVACGSPVHPAFMPTFFQALSE